MEEQPDLPRPTLTAALEAADDLSILSTDANDQLLLPAFTCYVCNLPGSTNRLTTCMSAPVYQSLTAHSNQQLLDPATVASDTMLQHLLQPGRAGTLARQTEGARHCKRHFHQPCLGRRKEAVFDNRVTAVRNPGSDSPETRVKDLRHRLCGECLQAVQGSTDNMYSGLLDGMPPLDLNDVCKPMVYLHLRQCMSASLTAVASSRLLLPLLPPPSRSHSCHPHPTAAMPFALLPLPSYSCPSLLQHIAHLLLLLPADTASACT